MLAMNKQAFLQARLLTLIRMSYKERLEQAMTLAKVDRKTLAEGIGLSVQAVGMVLTGVTKALTAENSVKAARFLKVDSEWLATGEGEARPPFMKERAALSPDAIEHAAAFSVLTPSEKSLWHTLVAAAKAGASRIPNEEERRLYEQTRFKPVTSQRRKKQG